MMGEASRLPAGAQGRPRSQASTRSATSTASAPGSPSKASINKPFNSSTQHVHEPTWDQAQRHTQQHVNQQGRHLSQEEAMMLEAAHHLQGNHNINMNIHFDAATQHNLSQQMPVGYHQHHPQAHDMQFASHHMDSNHSFHQNDSFVSANNVSLANENDESQTFMSNPSNVSGGNTRASRSSANNEMDMRQLFQQNKARSLDSVATDLHGNERGPNSERMRQLFAMLWISRHCTIGKSSVPRGRVYANYASRCATERVTVLNPASFGKLVRVLFQGLKTRRLGVRGESRYHYVNFGLIEDVCDGQDTENIPPSPKMKPSRPAKSSQASQKEPSLRDSIQSQDAEASHLPTPRGATSLDELEPSRKRRRSASFSVYNDQSIDERRSMGDGPDRRKTKIFHGFEPEELEDFDQGAPFVLPSMESYLPDHADREAAHTLAALYRSHCTSLAECVRFCRLDGFFHNYKAFHGTLTMPVQRILHLPEMAPWISHCDTILYQRIMRIVFKLAMQALPPQVLDMLRAIADKIVSNLQEFNHAQPAHVVAAREAPASVFAALVDRSVRVNLTAHAAANVMLLPKNRNEMWRDLVKVVKERTVAASVPSAASDGVMDIMINDMYHLLSPTKSLEQIEESISKPDLEREDEEQADEPGLDLISQWDAFFGDLRGRFPQATARDLMIYSDRVGSALTRDVIIAGGKSFTAWFVVKSWVDEMMAFKAEYGGFLEQTNVLSPELERAASTSNARPKTRNGPSTTANRETAAEKPATPEDSGTQATRAPFPSFGTATVTVKATTPLTNKTTNDNAVPEDSGIGIRTPEYEAMMDKYAMDKYTFETDDGILNGEDESVIVGR